MGWKPCVFQLKKIMEKPVFNIVSFSGGKDSTAMLLRMIEEGIPVDYVLFCDTGLEFPAMYEHIDKVEKETGIRITHVKAEETFEYMMLDKPIQRDINSPIIKRYGDVQGFGWPGPRMRWCTNRLKTQPRERFIKALQQHYEIKHYVGIAADETYRLKRKNNQSPNHIHPLVEWNMTEEDCLKYCYQRGYDWGGLYQWFKRVSCWCCPLQSLEELRQLRKHYPELWEKLNTWENKNFRTFRSDYSVGDLEQRFQLEEERKMCGLPIKGKEFYEELKKRIHREECL